MSQKTVRLTILLAINIAVIALSLLLIFYPTSTVSAVNTATTQGVQLDEQSTQNSFLNSYTLMQNAIFQPLLKTLTVIGTITLCFVVLSKIFVSHA
jgi:predicted Abi (CAAX) family protease